MAKTLGAKNKPKFVVVKLSELVQKFQPDMEIPIHINFAQAMRCQYTMVTTVNPEAIKMPHVIIEDEIKPDE